MAHFIGEPTLHPQFADLLSCAVEAGLAVDVYTNLTHVSAAVRAAWAAGIGIGMAWQERQARLAAPSIGGS